MFEIFNEGITLLNSISLLAFVTTVGLFFCGLPICRQIWKRKDTKEISGAPFMMGIIGGSCWWAYGYLKHDQTVLYVTTTQIILYSIYLIFYWFMSLNKLKCSLKLLVPAIVGVTLYAMIFRFGQKVHHPLGAICICLNIADFVAPLANIKYVIRKHSTQTLPMPLCIANFLVSTEWFIYGLLKQDFYLILPNGVGAVCAAGQLLLFIVLPRKTGLRSPLVKMVKFIIQCSADAESDLEADVAKVMPDDESNKISKHRWSDRVIANVTGEIGNVLQKCAIKDQFAYSGSLNERCNNSWETSTISEPTEQLDDLPEAENLKFTNNNSLKMLAPEQLDVERLHRQLSWKLAFGSAELCKPPNATATSNTTDDSDDVMIGAKRLKKAISEPNLRTAE